MQLWFCFIVASVCVVSAVTSRAQSEIVVYEVGGSIAAVQDFYNPDIFQGVQVGDEWAFQFQIDTNAQVMQGPSGSHPDALVGYSMRIENEVFAGVPEPFGIYAYQLTDSISEDRLSILAAVPGSAFSVFMEMTFIDFRGQALNGQDITTIQPGFDFSGFTSTRISFMISPGAPVGSVTLGIDRASVLPIPSPSTLATLVVVGTFATRRQRRV